MAKNCFIDIGYTKGEQMDLFGGVDITDPDIAKVAEMKRLDLLNKKRQVKMQSLKQASNLKLIRSHPMGPLVGLKALLTRDKFGASGFISVEQKANTILGYFHSQLADMFEKNRTLLSGSGKRVLGFNRDITAMENVIKEIYNPGSTGDEMAAAHAKSVSDVFEESRRMFNRAGGRIKKLEGWVPQKHSAVQVRKAATLLQKEGMSDQDAWVGFIWDKLDRQRMVNPLTETPYKDDELKRVLGEVYKSIVTEGAYKMEPGKLPKGVSSKISSRHSEHRFIHFKDGDSWVEYQRVFGSPDILTSVSDHLHMMSTEIAAMEVLGPNPDAAMRYLDDWTKKYQTDQEILLGNKKGIGASIREAISPEPQAIYDNVMGRTSIVKNEAANWFASVRNWMVATKLGSALLSAQSDHAFMSATAKFNNISAVRMYSRYVKNLNPSNAEDRMLATRLGIVAEYALDRAISAHRYSEVIGHNFAANVSEFSMRVSGLNAHTVAGKQAFAMEYLATLADEATRDWDHLSNARRSAFKRYGISKEDWEFIRAQPMEDVNGSKFVNPTKFGDFDKMNKVLGMVQSEMRLAVLEPDAFDRALLNRGSKAGELGGEMIRGTTQFKSFPVAVITNHLARGMMDRQKSTMSRAAYMGGVITAATVLGGLVIQSKEVSKGNDPMDMDQTFWWKAFAQGGGLGILSDFMTADLDRNNHEALVALGGPSAGVVSDLIMNVLVYPMQVAAGMYDKNVEEIGAKYGKSVSDAIKQYMPFNNLWYGRLVMERAVFDHVSEAIDPDWEKRQKRKIKQMEKERGQEQWWPAGEPAPIRAPKAPEVSTPFTGENSSDYIPEY